MTICDRQLCLALSIARWISGNTSLIKRQLILCNNRTTRLNMHASCIAKHACSFSKFVCPVTIRYTWFQLQSNCTVCVCLCVWVFVYNACVCVCVCRRVLVCAGDLVCVCWCVWRHQPAWSLLKLNLSLPLDLAANCVRGGRRSAEMDNAAVHSLHCTNSYKPLIFILFGPVCMPKSVPIIIQFNTALIYHNSTKSLYIVKM